MIPRIMLHSLRFILVITTVFISGCAPGGGANNEPTMTSLAPAQPTQVRPPASRPPMQTSPSITSPATESTATLVRIGVWHAQSDAIDRWAQQFMSDHPDVRITIIDKQDEIDRLSELDSGVMGYADVAHIALRDVDIALGIPALFTEYFSTDRVCPVSTWLEPSLQASLFDPSLARAFQRDATFYGAPIAVQIPLLSHRKNEQSSLPDRISWTSLVESASPERPIAAIGGIGAIWLGMMEERLGSLPDTVDPDILDGDLFRTTTIRLRHAVQERRVLPSRGASVVSQTVVWSDLDYPAWKDDRHADAIIRSELPQGSVADAMIETHAVVLPAPCPPTSSRIVAIAIALIRDANIIDNIGRNPALRAIPAAPEMRNAWMESSSLLEGEREAYEHMIARNPAVRTPDAWRLLASVVAESIFAPDVVSDNEMLQIIRTRWDEMSNATILD